jgi:thiol:disulfide interchange protein DsbC
MFKRWLSAAVLAVVGVQAFAADDAEKVVRDAFHKISPTANPTSVTPSELPGFYQVLVDATVYFVSSDGKYLVRGNVFDIASKQDLGERQLAALRKSTLQKIPVSKELVFAPKNPKYTVTVFTDVDCPYCREFHKKIAEYNNLGIAVNYVFFPLPMHPGADKKAEAVWCSGDRNASYTNAMNGKDPGGKTCGNPIAEMTELGRSMGVDGTPAVFTSEGDHIGGYVPPDQLIKRLDQLAQSGREVTQK